MKHAKRSGWRPFWAALCAALLVLLRSRWTDTPPGRLRPPLPCKLAAGGVKTELGVVVVLNDVPPSRGAGPQCSSSARRPAGMVTPWGMVAGGDVAHRRIAGGKSRQRQAVRVHRQAAAGYAVVFQHLPGTGVAGGSPRRRDRAKAGPAAPEDIPALRPPPAVPGRTARPGTSARYPASACRSAASPRASRE